MSKTASIKKPTITVIGPGRLGTALAIALERRGYKISALVGRRKASAKKAANLLDARVQALAIREIENLGIPELVVIATPDDEIPGIAKLLAKLKMERSSTAFHTSGALSSSVLHELVELNWSIGSIHPLVSVSDPIEGATALDRAYWCIEGDSRAIRIGRRIVRDLKGQSFSVSAESKPLYHAAAVMSAGSVTALFAVAIDMLVRCGLDRTKARQVLLPLLSSTVTNLSTQTPAKALTGTFSRGDVSTLALHLKALSHPELSDTLKLYRLLGRKALQLAKEDGLPADIAKTMEAKLNTDLTKKNQA